jgi:membrane protease subunit (stomatin/prohibitin family)
MNGSLLTVEGNHFCVLKSRGAILNVYGTGQYPVETPHAGPPAGAHAGYAGP